MGKTAGGEDVCEMATERCLSFLTQLTDHSELRESFDPVVDIHENCLSRSSYKFSFSNKIIWDL